MSIIYIYIHPNSKKKCIFLIHCSKSFCVSRGEMNLFQSCVPCGIILRIYSAQTMPPNHANVVLLKVVMNIDPPDRSGAVHNFKNVSLSSTCSSTSDTTTASYFVSVLVLCSSIDSVRYSIRVDKSLLGGYLSRCFCAV